MTTTAKCSSDILARARRSDKDFDKLMRQVDRFGGNAHLIQTIQKAADTAYSIGYLAGYTAAQSSIREALGIPVRD